MLTAALDSKLKGTEYEGVAKMAKESFNLDAILKKLLVRSRYGAIKTPLHLSITPSSAKRFLAGEIPVSHTIEMEMNRIDDLIANPRYFYDDGAIDGFIAFAKMR